MTQIAVHLPASSLLQNLLLLGLEVGHRLQLRLQPSVLCLQLRLQLRLCASTCAFSFCSACSVAAAATQMILDRPEMHVCLKRPADSTYLGNGAVGREAAALLYLKNPAVSLSQMVRASSSASSFSLADSGLCPAPPATVALLTSAAPALTACRLAGGRRAAGW